MSTTPDPLELFFGEFIRCAENTIADTDAELTRAAADPSPETMSSIVRGFHSLKGNSSFFEGNGITPLARAAEEAARRVSELPADDARALLPTLRQALERIRELVAVSRESGRPAAGSAEEPMLLGLEAIGAELTTARYFFAGTDVTDEIAALAAVADCDLGAGASDCAIAAAQILSDLARSVEAHDVARALEALDIRRPAAGPAPALTVAPEAVRAALKLLAPLLLPASDGSTSRAA